ncbi:MAG: hypothetical protein ACHQD8_05315 [Chitinophagales bacterium]
MEFTPFTIEEATEICEDFEDLKDTEFTLGTSAIYLVHDVVVSPFHEGDKKEFIESYFSAKDSARPMSPFSGSEYDVILFASDVNDETEHVHISIRTFAGQNGIRYNFPVHA